jgi:hypothetical protein
MAHDVFICHSSKDKTVADAVCSTLEHEGIRCWIAPRDVLAGLSYGEAIIEAINGAKVMIIVFSSSANASPQIEREIERAVNRNIRVVQFRIEDVVPREALEYFLSAPHWLDAFTPPISRHLKVLAEQVKALLDHDVATHHSDPGPLAPAPEAPSPAPEAAGATVRPPPPFEPEAAPRPTAAPHIAPSPAPSASRGGMGMGLVAGAILLGAVLVAAVVWFALSHHGAAVTAAQSAASAAPASAAAASTAAAAPAPAATAPAQPAGSAIMAQQPAAPAPSSTVIGAAPASGTCLVADPTPTPLNIRNAPNGWIVGAIGNGAAVQVVQRQSVNGQGWAEIVPEEAGAKSGWVFASYLNCG